MSKIIEIGKKPEVRQVKLTPGQSAEAKLFFYVNEVVKLHRGLGITGPELDLALKSALGNLDRMKLESPTKYAEDGVFFENRIRSRVKFLKRLIRFAGDEILEDKERQKRKVELV